MGARQWPVREECLLTVQMLLWVFKSLEGDCGMDRVLQCCLLTPFQEGTHHKLVAQKNSKFCKQGGKLDYSRYSQVSLLTLRYHWQTLSISFFLEMAIAKVLSFTLTIDYRSNLMF